MSFGQPATCERQLGSALGIAILGTVLFTTTANVLDAKLDERGLSDEQREQTVSAVVDSAGAAPEPIA